MTTSRDLVSSLATLHLFSKIRPDLMAGYADTLQPYLEIKCDVSISMVDTTQNDWLLYNLNQILTLTWITKPWYCMQSLHQLTVTYDFGI